VEEREFQNHRWGVILGAISVIAAITGTIALLLTPVLLLTGMYYAAAFGAIQCVACYFITRSGYRQWKKIMFGLDDHRKGAQI
jgi:hypothetical protein